VVPAWPLETAVTVVERLRAATPAALTTSAGVASWNRQETAMELFARADAALYEAKQSGRNRTVAARGAAHPHRTWRRGPRPRAAAAAHPAWV
jgi:predicted signal transduction protein with EAL and GGDEF domain